MFTGIIETLGEVKRIVAEGSNRNFLIRSSISKELKIDQSLSHNGVCLTVTRLEDGGHWTTAVGETLQKSNLGQLMDGAKVNLERSMLNNGRFDGHLVQGHVDLTATVKSIKDENGSWLFDFEHDAGAGFVTVEKGSVCVNGISLTCFKCTPSSFRVAIIPYTFENTNLKSLNPGDRVNIEFDIVGKYVERLMSKAK